MLRVSRYSHSIFNPNCMHKWLNGVVFVCLVGWLTLVHFNTYYVIPDGNGIVACECNIMFLVSDLYKWRR